MALLEFALCLPVLVIIALWIFELINFALVREEVSQLALQVADNAARIGTQTNVQTQIDEKQINDLFTGASLQAGDLDLDRRGRIILSSLEVGSSSGSNQYIHWQRCFGAFAHASTYGQQGDFMPNGMGPPDGRIKAMSVAPAMFVEIGYSYVPLVSSVFAPSDTITEIATMLVRDNRDTTDPGVNPVAGTQPSRC